MNPFQKLADWIKSRKTPKWLLDLSQELLDNVIIPTAEKIGEQAIEHLKAQIVFQSSRNIPGSEKFKNVVSACKSHLAGIPESVYTSLINNLVVQFKVTGKF